HKDWNGCTVDFQLLQIERHGKQRAPVHVQEMTARRVAAKSTAPHESFPAVVRQRHHFNTGNVKVSNGKGVRGEQYGLPAGQDLGPTMDSFSLSEFGNRRGWASR